MPSVRSGGNCSLVGSQPQAQPTHGVTVRPLPTAFKVTNPLNVQGPQSSSKPLQKAQYVADVCKKNKPYYWCINHLEVTLSFDNITDSQGSWRHIWNHSEMDSVFLLQEHHVSVQHEKASRSAITHLCSLPHGPHVFDISRGEWWWLLNGPAPKPKHTQNTLISHAETYMPLLLYNKGFEYRGLTMTPGQLFTALRVCITLYTFFYLFLRSDYLWLFVNKTVVTLF